MFIIKGILEDRTFGAFFIEILKNIFTEKLRERPRKTLT